MQTELNIPKPPEKDQHAHRWLKRDELANNYHDFEGWSQLVLNSYFDDVV